MKLSQFQFDLPLDKIAKEPTRWRDECKLMVLHKDTGEIEHKLFKDLLDYFSKDDIFVLNDTKVFPARLYGKKEKTGADIEVFLLRELNREQHLWDVIVEPARKIRIGNKLYFFGEEKSPIPDGLVAEVIDNTTSRGRTLRFLYDGDYETFKESLFRLGKTPVPKWVKMPDEVTELDAERYQTYFAKNEGAVVAPAAGMHFSREMFNRMILKDIRTTAITMHIGTEPIFGVNMADSEKVGRIINSEIEVEDLSKHRMESSRLIIGQEAADKINKAKKTGHKILSVGIATAAGLETYVTTNNEVKPYDSWTNKYIYPPYKYAVPDAIVTNFHLPGSTMVIATAAFGGYENVMKKAYAEALKEGSDYKFGPYGDALLII